MEAYLAIYCYLDHIEIYDKNATLTHNVYNASELQKVDQIRKPNKDDNIASLIIKNDNIVHKHIEPAILLPYDIDIEDTKDIEDINEIKECLTMFMIIVMFYILNLYMYKAIMNRYQ